MKNLVVVTLLAIVLFGCSSQKSKKQIEVQAGPEVAVLSVDALIDQAADLADKEIVVKGTVMHVCTHGGQRCFLMGSNEDVTIRIEAGEKIGSFSQELMGSDIEITGVLREVKTEAQAHNPGQHESAEGEKHEESAETEKAHEIIAESNEGAEAVYFIEGLKSKEL